MKTSPSSFVVTLTCGLLTLVWGTTWGAISVGLKGIPPFTGVALRFAIASLLLTLLARLMKVPMGLHPVEKWLWLVHGVLSFSVSYGVVYWAEQWVPSGLSAVLFATFTLFVTILAHYFLPDERLSVKSLVGVVAGFLGVAVIFSDDFSLLGGQRVLVAAAVMLISPLASAAAQVAVKRWGQDVHHVSLNAVAMALGASVMAILAVSSERSIPVRFDAVSVGSVLYLAVFGSALTFSLYFWLLRHVSATRLSLIAYGIPVVAVLVGVVLLDEPLTTRTILGGVLVMAGVGLAVHRRP